MNTTDNEWIDELLETMACVDCSGYPIEQHERARQAILQKLQEVDRQARVDEINRMRNAMTFNHMTPSIYAAERIATLASEDDTGVNIQCVVCEEVARKAKQKEVR